MIGSGCVTGGLAISGSAVDTDVLCSSKLESSTLKPNTDLPSFGEGPQILEKGFLPSADRGPVLFRNGLKVSSFLAFSSLARISSIGVTSGFG